MKLYVMRHGPAEEHVESGVDADRPLTPLGRERVRAVADLLLREGEEPFGIVTSPLVRAVQTAEIVALETRLGQRSGTVEVRPAMAPRGDALGLARRLVAEGRRRVLVVGHEPDLSGLLAALFGTFARSFDKAMVAGIALPPGPGPARLRFLLDPKALRFDPDGRRAGGGPD